MSAESESLLVIGGIFAIAAVILSVLLIVVRRASLRFDAWLLGKIRLRLMGIQFYGWCVVSSVLAWHRKSLNNRGIILFKERRKGAARG